MEAFSDGVGLRAIFGGGEYERGGMQLHRVHVVHRVRFDRLGYVRLLEKIDVVGVVRGGRGRGAYRVIHQLRPIPQSVQE